LNCEVVYGKDVDSDIVSFGTSVKIKNKSSGDNWTYNIVGPVEYELESMDDIMTYTSPLAKQLIGKKKGEDVEVQLPRGLESMKILEIEPIE